MEGRMRQRKERMDVNINKVMKERRKRKGQKSKEISSRTPVIVRLKG